MVCADQVGYSESESFFSFIRAIDPQNVLHIDASSAARISSSNPCMMKLKGVRCDSEGTNIVVIRLENMNLSGTIDAESLCRLKKLRVLSLAENNIRGVLPNSILNCARLSYLNLSSNHLSGKIPSGLMKLKFLRKLDISNNNFAVSLHHQESNHFSAHSLMQSMADAPVSTITVSDDEGDDFSILYVLVIGIMLLFFGFYFASIRVGQKSNNADNKNNNKTLKSIKQFHIREATTEVKEEEEMKKMKKIRDSDELVFFEENERFTMADLLQATAELRSQSFCSCLYEVKLKNGAHYAVKRFKDLQISPYDFNETLRRISMLKHPNILPLVGYRSATEEKLVIYRYQNNGSLLNLFKDHLEGKKYFSWKLRLSIARGIAKGLAFIHQKIEQAGDIIPHGNLKLSNILLNNSNEPLISEHGLSKFLDTTTRLFFISGLAYTAPERSLSEKADVYSFGVILLELLTGKSIELSGIDLTKWVRSMVKEEWTVEVFDKEVRESEYQWAFPVLNTALMCVSSLPETRPSMEEIVEMIEEVTMEEKEEKEGDDDNNVHTTCCPIVGSNQKQDFCSLHKIIPDTWDSPASNY
ncbi:leucine-rich repeat receptor-like protein kinase PXC1 [Neltuma alba]|uniref:leucine-rich repeat receptor-like protein kinase PXC1 n=1 Tax=Neltuma alba TaxID=207710 RepID=UPI0010A4347F|nr:leucine-rich repeat receptor-like protein kinase PXC1 [Prosopis alba]